MKGAEKSGKSKQVENTVVVGAKNSKESQKALRRQLKEIIGAKKIERSSKATRMNALETTLKSVGLDKDKFMEDLAKVQKEQGNKFEIHMTR